MTPTVFLGPSLPLREAQNLIQADFRPPIRQGDVYRVVRERRPRAIGIVDGYFQEVPSVWHKEILWAIDQGVAVFGAASMGALRAAELERFGMRGVGRVFEAFRDGVYRPYDTENFEDDDEVAVIHGPAELGFPALSDAMVDLRSTFARAAAEGVIDDRLRDRIVAAFKARFYRDRSLSVLPEIMSDIAVPAAQSRTLSDWLRQGRVWQKGDDAKALLEVLQGDDAGDLREVDAQPFVFERTTLWAQFVESDETENAGKAVHAITAVENRVLDELRLEPDLYAELRPLAVLRFISSTQTAAAAPSLEERRAALNHLRRRNGLWSRAALENWAKANDLDREGFDRLIETEAMIEQQSVAAGAKLDIFLLDVLRSSGRYEALARRAAEKVAVDDGEGSRGIEKLTPAFLIDWFFEQRLGRALPHDPDEVSKELGFATFEGFVATLAREYRYARRNSGVAAVDGGKVSMERGAGKPGGCNADR